MHICWLVAKLMAGPALESFGGMGSVGCPGAGERHQLDLRDDSSPAMPHSTFTLCYSVVEHSQSFVTLHCVGEEKC